MYWARLIFSWEYSILLIPIFWGVALTMLSIAPSIESSGIWFGATYFFAVMATAWSIGAWCASDILRKYHPGTWVGKKRKRATRNDWRKFSCLRWAGVLLFILPLAVIIYFGLSLQESIELERLHGKLFPANEDTPANECASLIEEDTLLLFLGKIVAIPPSLPSTILRIGKKDVMTLDRSEDGALVLSFDITSKDGKIVARFNRGEFTINPNNILRKHRSDRSSLTILDQNGAVVLEMKYLNKRAMWINAEFPGITFKGSNTAANAPCLGNPLGGPIMERGENDPFNFLF